jgi:hypothetical protein
MTTQDGVSAKAAQLESWAVIGLMGHSSIAGFVREVSVGTGTFLRVDVPEVAYEEPDYSAPFDGEGMRPRRRVVVLSFVRLVSIAAVYDITPCSEEVARQAAENIRLSPPAEQWRKPDPNEPPF